MDRVRFGGNVVRLTCAAVLELNAKLKDAEVKRISAEERLKLLDAQLQRAQHQVTRTHWQARLVRAIKHAHRSLHSCSSASAAHT